MNKSIYKTHNKEEEKGMEKMFTWVPFYQEFANKLLAFKNDRQGLIEKLKVAFDQCGEKFPKVESDREVLDLDPFTVFGFFNKHKQVDDKRIAIIKSISLQFGVEVDVPVDFFGIPTVMPFQAAFFPFKVDGRGDEDINQLWELFESAIKYADSDGKLARSEFIKSYEAALKIKGDKAKLTMALFWIRPEMYLNLDSLNRKYIKESKDNLSLVEKFPVLKGWIVSSGETYLAICDELKNMFGSKDYPLNDFKAFSLAAWKMEVESGEHMDNADVRHPLNQILVGPPGTGKTYNTVIRAVAIVEGKSVDAVVKEPYLEVKKRFDALKKDERICFTTFHQSYGYEDFMLGIRPNLDGENDNADLTYKCEPGIFKRFCDNAERVEAAIDSEIEVPKIGKNPRVWKVSLNGTGPNEVRSDCLENGRIRVGYDEAGPEPSLDDVKKGRNVLKAFYERMQIGDVVVSCYSQNEVDAIGVVCGEPEWNDRFDVCKRVRDVDWLAKGLHENIVSINQGKRFTLSTVYETNIRLDDVLNILRRQRTTIQQAPHRKCRPYVFIIDEINRGNISKIFGELITLIEPLKRLGKIGEMRVRLPNAREDEPDFGIPENVYIIGTMNTADRSIAMLDTALRRRFEFVEMMPDYEVLQKAVGAAEGDVDVARMLQVMNARIEVLLDREHQIGHAYFLELGRNPTLESVGMLFKNKVIPLLQEYFYDDYEKIRMVLGDGWKDGKFDFIEKHMVMGDGEGVKKLFPCCESEAGDIIGDEKCVYRVRIWTDNDNVYVRPETYRKIYDEVKLPGEE